MSEDVSATLAARIRVMQMLTGALANGAFVVLAITGFLRFQDLLPLTRDSFLPYLGLGVAGICALLSFVMPLLMSNRWRAKNNSDTLSHLSAPTLDNAAAPYQAQLILGMALLEGAAILQGIVFLIAGNVLNLAVGAALVIGILLRFPTLERLRAWAGIP